MINREFVKKYIYENETDKNEESVSDWMSRNWKAGKEKAEEIAHEADKKIKDNPYKSMTGAALAAAAGSLALRRIIAKRREQNN